MENLGNFLSFSSGKHRERTCNDSAEKVSVTVSLIALSKRPRIYHRAYQCVLYKTDEEGFLSVLSTLTSPVCWITYVTDVMDLLLFTRS